jgi:hypothetical protein
MIKVLKLTSADSSQLKRWTRTVVYELNSAYSKARVTPLTANAP